jgi:hypothetical protein
VDITNVESAYFTGYSKFERWKAKFDVEFYKPWRDGMLLALWNSMTPDAKEQLKQMDKESYDYLLELVEQGE